MKSQNCVYVHFNNHFVINSFYHLCYHLSLHGRYLPRLSVLRSTMIVDSVDVDDDDNEIAAVSLYISRLEGE